MDVKLDTGQANLTPQQTGNLKKLKTLSKEFESYFFKEVISAMRKTVPKNTLINGGHAEEIYKSMLDDNMAKEMSNRGGSGIARVMYDRLSKAYLNTIPPPSPEKRK
ncbi:MAG: rod-binding protein [Nitrospinota bacterium]